MAWLYAWRGVTWRGLVTLRISTQKTVRVTRDLCTCGCTLERDTVARTWVRMRHPDQEVLSGTFCERREEKKKNRWLKLLLCTYVRTGDVAVDTQLNPCSFHTIHNALSRSARRRSISNNSNAGKGDGSRGILLYLDCGEIFLVLVYHFSFFTFWLSTQLQK